MDNLYEGNVVNNESSNITIRFATTTGQICDKDSLFINLNNKINNFPLGSCITLNDSIYIIDRDDRQIISQIEPKVLLDSIVWIIENLYNKTSNSKIISVYLPKMTNSLLEEADFQSQLYLSLQKFNLNNRVSIVTA